MNKVGIILIALILVSLYERDKLTNSDKENKFNNHVAKCVKYGRKDYRFLVFDCKHEAYVRYYE